MVACVLFLFAIARIHLPHAPPTRVLLDFLPNVESMQWSRSRSGFIYGNENAVRASAQPMCSIAHSECSQRRWAWVWYARMVVPRKWEPANRALVWLPSHRTRYMRPRTQPGIWLRINELIHGATINFKMLPFSRTRPRALTGLEGITHHAHFLLLPFSTWV